jgi:cytoskeletal protein CcmA (bactofilin family)
VGLISSKKRPEEGPEPVMAGGGEVDSVIGAGMVLDGDCETSGSLRVDGHVKGNVRARRLTIAASGRVDGDVSGPEGGTADGGVLIDGRVNGMVNAPRVEVGREGAVGGGMRVREAVVRGRVQGAVVTEHRLLLEATAVVEGDVTARRLGLAEGGQVFGTIRIGDRAPGSQAGGGSGPGGYRAAGSTEPDRTEPGRTEPDQKGPHGGAAEDTTPPARAGEEARTPAES